MSEKLIIKNFGPIKSAEIELKRFTVLIGEQATGKSTIAKLLAVCRYFSYVHNFTIDQGFLEGLKNWGLYDYIDMDGVSEVQYICDDYTLKVRSVNGALQQLLLNKSERFQKLEDDASIYENSLPPSFFLNNVSQIMDNPFFLPVERGLQSIFSLGKSSIQNISDSLFNQLAKLDQVGRTFNSETAIEPLHITYKNDAGRGFIKKEKDDKFYSLNNAASGYQTAIPIILVCKYYHERRKKNKTFVVEEPELSLFPSAQKDLMYYLVQEINKYQSKLLLTTHSPYTLTSLNNCMYSYKIGKVNHAKTKKIVPEANWLNSDEVSCYMLRADGTAEDILDRESSLIEADKIDEVSSVLNLEFDKLLDIEFAE